MSLFFKRLICSSLLSFMVTHTLFADEMQKPKTNTEQSVIILNTKDIKWGAANILRGEERANLQGDSSKAEIYTYRAKFRPNSKIPPHWNDKDTFITVISGSADLGLVDTVDMSKSTRLTAGAFVAIPAKTHFWISYPEETVIQFNAMGPFGVHFINPNDDPRNKK